MPERPPNRKVEAASGPRPVSSVVIGLTVYAVWVLATYALEGRPRTLLRPEASGLRLAYAAVANMAVGIACTAWVSRSLIARRVITADRAGFRDARRALFTGLVGLGLGLAVYFLQGAPIRHPIAVLNAFAQVWPVSTAEILVCWALIGSTVEAAWRGPMRVPGAALTASASFGLYHLAHSPPFNTARMVGLLTAVGIGTSLFFFVARDVYGTVAFHNGLALYGVATALDGAGASRGLERPNVPLLLTALGSLVLLAALHRTWLRPVLSRARQV